MLPPEQIRQAIEQRLAPPGGRDPADWQTAGGGLSNASVWRVEIEQSVYAVRRWWSGIDCRLIEWIAQSLWAAQGTCQFVAAPTAGLGDDCWPYRDAHDGRWEAAPWKPGSPLTTESSSGEISAAVEGLARFHRRLRTGPPCPINQPFALDERRRRLSRLLAGPAIRLDRRTAAQWPELAELSPQLGAAAAKTATLLQNVSPPTLGLPQPIHGDARPEHFLLRDGQLTGLIDFGAMRSDSVLVDIARLAGELAPGDRDRRDEVIGLYERAAGEPVDRAAVAALDASGAVLSAVNWIRWLSDPAGPQREPALVRERLRSIAARLADSAV